MNVIKLNNVEQAEWRKWLNKQSPIVRKTAKKYPPYKYFYLPATDKVCIPYSYADDGTITVTIKQTFNKHTKLSLDRRVFGISPSDLAPIPKHLLKFLPVAQ
jgi:predicted secreted Zn-dependent protease